MEWRRNVPIGIYLAIDPEGRIEPLRVALEDGREFTAEVLDVASVHGHRTGVEYTVRLGGRFAYLYDNQGVWSLEGAI